MALLAALGLSAPAAAQSLNAAQRSQVDVFVARTGLPRAWVTSIKPGMVVAIRDREGLATRAAGEKIRLHGEVVDEETAERLGYRSMRSVVEVNCETHRDRVVEMEVFASPNLKGEGQARKLPGGWVQPSQDAYMADVIRAACRGVPRTEFATQDAPAPKTPPAPAKAPPRPPTVAVAPEQAPPLRPVAFAPAPPPRAPGPDGPIATAPRPPRLLVSEAERAPPVTAPAPSAPALPPPKPAPPKPPAAKPAPPVVASAAPGGPIAQVGALSSEANARRALSALSPLMGGLGARIQTATVDGRTFYRAFVTGFASRADATAFCAKVAAKGGPCLVR